MVLAIISVGLALVAPDMRRSLDTIRYRTAVRQLAATLRYARSEAVHTKITQQVILDSEEGKYSLSSLSKKGRPDDEDAEEKEADEKTGPSSKLREGKLPQGMAVEAAEESFVYSDDEQRLVVSFFAKGGSSGPDLVLEGGETEYRLEVDVVTGRVRIANCEK